jgi:RNA polymerase sigma-70 factor, ECF subfamily
MITNQLLQSARLGELDERQLLALAKAGQEGAFEQLVSRARDQCFRTAMCVLRNYADASDVVQTAFWKASRGLGGFAEESKFSTWVTRIVVNECMMCLRSRRMMKLTRSDPEWQPLDSAVSGDRLTSSPEYQFASEEIRGLVRSELRALPRLLRTAVELKHFREYSMESVAAELGISVGAAKSRLCRGQKYLRARLLRHCGERGVATLTP